MLHEITVSIVGYERAGGAENWDTVWEVKMHSFCNCVVASCSIGLVVLIQIALSWEDLPVSLLNAQSHFFWIETVHGQIQVSGLEEGTPFRLWIFLMVCMTGFVYSLGYSCRREIWSVTHLKMYECFPQIEVRWQVSHKVIKCSSGQNTVKHQCMSWIGFFWE